MSLEFTLPHPASGEQQQLTFSCVNEYAGFRISLTAFADVDTRDIDTGAGDFTTTVPVDCVDFVVYDECGLRVAGMTIERWTELDALPVRLSLPVQEHCYAMAQHLFRVGLTFTTFQRGNAQ
jgi:hypothetical protein